MYNLCTSYVSPRMPVAETMEVLSTLMKCLTKTDTVVAPLQAYLLEVLARVENPSNLNSGIA